MDRVYKSLNEVLYHCTRKYSKRDAFLYRLKDQSITSKTYGEFLADVETVGNFYISKGLKHRKIVLIGENTYQWIVAYFAGICSDNVIVPLDKEMSLAMLQNILRTLNSGLLIFSENYADKINMLEEGITEGLMSLSDIQKIYEGEQVRKKLTVSDIHKTATIIYTSGTTGTARGVELSHYNIASGVTDGVRAIKYKGVAGLILPANHIFATVDNLTVSICQGTCVGICSDMMNFMTDMKDYHVTVFGVVPAILEAIYKKLWWNIRSKGMEKKVNRVIKLCNFFKRFGINLRPILLKSIRNAFGGKLKYIICGGAYLDEKYSRGFEELGINIIVGYGITECTGGVAIDRRDVIRHGSVGLIFKQTEIKIRALEGISAPDGEILIKGPQVMLGYYQNPEATEEAFEDGWFKSGDIGHIDDEGYLYITGRDKNLIILGNGKNVSPEELERKICNIPGTREVLVSEHNNSIMAEIFPDYSNNRSDYLEYYKQEINKINQTLENHKRISEVVIRDTELPKTSFGKIKRTHSLLGGSDLKQEREYKAPRNEAEQYLCECFAKALKIDKVGITDNFFGLGGDSLSVLELCTMVDSTYSMEPVVLYDNPTVLSLINYQAKNRENDDGDKIANINELIPDEQQVKNNKKHEAKNILLTGATGYLGSHILKELLSCGYNVTCLVRSKEKLEQIGEFYFKENFMKLTAVSVFVGDITKNDLGLAAEDYNYLVNNIDTVIHTAALVKHVGNYSEHAKINVTGTKHIVNFCLKSKAVLYHTSTVYVSGFAGDGLRALDEHHLDIGQRVDRNVYFKSKYKAEEIVLSAMSKGLNANILRVGNLTWRKDGIFQINIGENGFVSRLKALFAIGVYPKSWEKLGLDFTAVDDCAEAFVKLLLTGMTGRIWHLISDKQITIPQICDILKIQANPVEDETFEKLLGSNMRKKDVSILSMYYRMIKEGMNLEIDNNLTCDTLRRYGFEWKEPYVSSEYIKKIMI